MSNLGIRERYRIYKNSFIRKHRLLAQIRDRLIWLLFHLNRGKGFWTQWIDYVKYIIYLLITIASLKTLGIDIQLPQNIMLILSGIIVLGIMLLFLITSQFMDWVRWQEKETEQSNVRNYLAIELRQWMKKATGKKESI